ncbi:rod-binding protein [Phenylobacterium sp.]|uniref:rod-binding protein n=1 Tax=Phenylobacterium sp. TaxID=1871053 RepID=UPI00286B3BA0|nr:rod-binding protein [Phenylobacterium sp.]
MADLTALAVPPSLLAAPRTAQSLSPPSPAAPGVGDLAKRSQIAETARKFEASFLSIMVQQMFEGVDTAAPFGGGPGESMFKSFMSEAIAGKMTKAGGVGVAASVQREMLKMQGLN